MNTKGEIKPDYTITASLLMAFNQYLDGAPFMQEEDLIRRIKKEKVGNQNTSFGTIIHEYLETGDPSYLTEVQQAKLKPFYESFKDLKKEKNYNIDINTPYGIVRIRTKLDGESDNSLHEFKTTTRNIESKRYYNSMQWKIYSYGKNKIPVTYHIFRYTTPSNEIVKLSNPFKNVEIQEYKYFTFKFHDRMIEEIEEAIIMLINYCEYSKLTKYIINT